MNMNSRGRMSSTKVKEKPNRKAHNTIIEKGIVVKTESKKK